MKVEVRSVDVEAALQDLIDRGEDLEPVLNRIGASLKTRIQASFRAGEDPDGVKWSPLAIRRGQPLRDTGRLMNSITYRADGSTLDVGTNVCYAPVHQFGAVVEAGKPPHPSLCGYQTKGAKILSWTVAGRSYFARRVVIPARPFLPFGDLPGSWEADITDELAGYFGPQ